jgi:hypothetical protein
MMRSLVALLVLAIPVSASADKADSKPAAADKKFTGGTGQTVNHDCGAGGKVVIEISSSKITLTGECAKVDLLGSQNTVTIASTLELVVGGTENRGTLDAVDSITTLGNRNTLTYKRPVKAKSTKLALLGKGNSATVAK